MKNLDLRTKIDLTDKQKKLAIVTGACILFLLSGWLLAVQPAVNRIQTLKQTRQIAQQRFRLASEVSELREEKQKFSRVLGDIKDRHIILAKVTELAQNMKIDINTITPSLEQKQQFPELLFELSGKALFPPLMQFLKSLETADPGVFVRKIEINVGGQRKTGMVRSIPEISMTLVTYLKSAKTVNFQPSQTTDVET